MAMAYGCGGGGGDCGSTDPTTDFPLYETWPPVPGFEASGNLSGTVTAIGGEFAATGAFSYETLPMDHLDAFNLDVIPIITVITVNIPLLTIDISITTTTYLNAETGNYEPVYMVIERNDGDTVTVVTAIPSEVNLLLESGDTAQVGASGDLGLRQW